MRLASSMRWIELKEINMAYRELIENHKQITRRVESPHIDFPPYRDAVLNQMKKDGKTLIDLDVDRLIISRVSGKIKNNIKVFRGYNYFIPGTPQAFRESNLLKNRFTIHAERHMMNSTPNYAKRYMTTVMVYPWPPCSICAKELVDTYPNMKRLVFATQIEKVAERWREDVSNSLHLLQIFGVDVIRWDIGEYPQPLLIYGSTVASVDTADEGEVP